MADADGHGFAHLLQTQQTCTEAAATTQCDCGLRAAGLLHWWYANRWRSAGLDAAEPGTRKSSRAAVLKWLVIVM